VETKFDEMNRTLRVSLIRAKGSRPLISFLSVTLFLVMWELLPRLNLVNASYISQPSRVLTVAAEEIFHKGEFFDHLYVSFIEFSMGFILALAVGIPLGMIIGVFRKVRYLLDPPIMALWSTPMLALIPLFILWLGVGVESKLAVVFIMAVIPIIVNAVAGIREVDFPLVRAARSFCAKQRDIFIKILLPGSLPALMTGVRLGLGRAIMGMVAGEMYCSTKGLGHQLMASGQAFRMDLVVFYVSVVCLLGVSATNLMRKLETRLQRWRTTG